ncbi:spore cortex biosynthesis protein YabQ [Desulfovirgula thermocuniculi]|uniref:spore cortex biosynthesis protein YabQ n=1 Tax=Desulfovirgula thermocuniculi TaxID=348842 RepID=UPI0003FD1490|nr:spore cortex biosynthesis protein YabQ [Desulfovirgula thermocuniculi]
MSVGEQAGAFLLTVALGAAAGLFYDFYRALIRLLRLRGAAGFAGDLFFCLFLLAFVFAALLYFNYGEVRFYVLLGLALGMALYRLGPGRVAGTFFYRALHAFSRRAGAAARVALAPLSAARRALARMCPRR